MEISTGISLFQPEGLSPLADNHTSTNSVLSYPLLSQTIYI